MANTIRIKRRISGNSGAPTTLASAELAYNEVDNILYYGKGDNGSGVATSVISIGGDGKYVTEVTGTSPISSSGGKTPAISLAANYGDTQNPYASKTANFVLASPNGSSGTPSFRALVAADIPSLTASKISDFQTTVLAYRLDQFAAPTSSVAFNNQKITGLGTPTLDADAATKAYVDAMSSGVHAHPAARVATTANLAATYNNASGTLTATSNGAISVDSVSLSANDRVLVKDQTSKVQNGIYVVTTVGTAGTPFLLTRASDMNESSEFPASFVFVSEGSTQADNGYVCTTNSPVTIGTTDIDFTQFSGAGQITAGDGMTKSGNTLNVASTGGGSLTVGADSINLTSGIATAGTYKSVTVDTYGRVTAGTNPTTLSGYGITDALSNSTSSTQDGYFGNIHLYDDSTPSHYLQITNSANLTGARTLSVNVNDADRTVSLSGNLTVSSAATISGTNTGDQTITLTGDVTGAGTGSFATTLANSGVAAGTYNDSATAVRPFTVDAKGRVTSIGTAVTIAPAFSSIASKPTTLSGYGITDALSNSTSSTQSGYFGDIYLYDDSTPSHYLQITNSANLTAARLLSVNVNDADRTVSLSGNLTVSSAATISGTNTGDQTITLTGDVTGSGTGSFATTLANSGVAAGTYNDSATAVRPFTVDAKGRITSIGTAVTVTPAFSSITSKPTSLSGYGITDGQPLDATLTALAAVSTSANTVIYATGSDTFTTTSLTSFGRSLIDDADNTTARSTLGLGTIATQAANNVTITGGSIDNISIDGGTF